MAADPYAQMLESYGVTADLLSDEDRRSLDDQGFVVFPNFIETGWLEELRAAFDQRLEIEGSKAGTEFKVEEGAPRLANCVNKGPVFERAFRAPRVLAVAAYVIGRPFKLHGYNAREPLPGQGHQELHSDNPQPAALVNALWLLDDFEKENGATRVVPGSHLKGGGVRDELPDPRQPHPNEIILTAPAGTVLVINGRTWHGGTRNDAGTRRRVLHISYIARELPQQVEQRPNLLHETYLGLSEADRYLLNV